MSKVKGQRSSVKKGFSIIEVIFSVFVITVGLTAVLAVMARSILNSLESRNTIIASQLAQEGIEAVRNIRDNNWVKSRVSFDASYFPNNNNKQCTIDYLDDKLDDNDQCKNTAYYDLYLKNQYYQHDNTGTKTKYMRKILLLYQDDNGNPSNRASAKRAMAVSIVTWSGTVDYDDNAAGVKYYRTKCNMLSRCVYVEDTLTIWHE